MKSGKVRAYADHLIAIAGASHARIELAMPLKKAQAMRFELYGLRRAVELEGAEEQFPAFMRAKIRVEPTRDGAKLIIAPPEELDLEAKRVIEQALSLARDQDTRSPVENTRSPAQSTSTAGPYSPFLLNTDPNQKDTGEFESAIEAWLAEGANAPAPDTQHPMPPEQPEK